MASRGALIGGIAGCVVVIGAAIGVVVGVGAANQSADPQAVATTPSSSPTPSVDPSAEAEQQRLAEEAEQQRLAEEAEQQRLADEAALQERLAQPCWGPADDLTVLVNKWFELCPIDYVPNLVEISSIGGLMRPEAAAAFDQLEAALEAETGYYLWNTSSYRSYDTQVSTYQGWVDGYGQAEADTFSARPGHSEHQTGLAIDVGASSCGCSDEPFGHTPEGQWVAMNAWRFGFIVRYPPGMESITGYIWEPWHLRFVGTEIAAAMNAGQIQTLEEYYGMPPAPNYR